MTKMSKTGSTFYFIYLKPQKRSSSSNLDISRKEGNASILEMAIISYLEMLFSINPCTAVASMCSGLS